MINILMVCIGNICRSPLAEGILKSKLFPNKFYIDSAGTKINLYDFTSLKKVDINFNWNIVEKQTEKSLSLIVKKSKTIKFNENRVINKG